MKKVFIIFFFNTILCKEIIFPSIALVLSGGGAKGIAQIPTIELIDSLNIPIDYVVGTSIGSIAGGMYSIGYSPEELKEIFFDTNWDLLISNKKNRKKLNFFKKNNYQKYQLSFTLHDFKPKVPIALSNGHESFINLNYLTRHNNSIYNFDEFVIPFRCNATDLISGSEIIFKNGSLAKALRASSSIPTVFSPIQDNKKLLVDGGVLNNLGTDIAKSLGADIIIAVDVSSENKKSKDIIDVFDVLSQSIQLNSINKKNKNKGNADILIEPKITGSSSLNFNLKTAEAMYKTGYSAAYKNLENLIKIKNSLPLNKIISNQKLSSIQSDSILISEVILKTNSSITVNEVLNLKLPKKISKKDLIKEILKIRHSNQFNNISFEFLKNNNSYRLIIKLEKNNSIKINKVMILGNKKISDTYIRKILDLNRGDIVDYDKIDSKISQLYNLDFFENINYELVNFDNNSADILFNVNETNFKRLKLGGGWSSYHKMIAKLRLDLIYKPIDMFRFQNEMLIANSIKENKLSLLYTGKYIKQLPIMPILRYNYKDTQLPMYQNEIELEENIIDKQRAFGFLIPFQNFGSFEVNYNNQKIKYSSLHNENIDFYNVILKIDQLDDLLYPTQGLNLSCYFEQSDNLQENYYYSNLSVDHYTKILKRTSIRLYGDYIESEDLNSSYKNIHFFKPDRTLAYSEYDIFSSNLLNYGIEINYLYRTSQTIRFLINKIDKVEFAHNNEKIHNFYSYGIGIRFKSILGPINFLWTNSDKSFFDNKKNENYYFSIGIDY